MKQACILILGMHRSGTSALSGTLNILDVYLGADLTKPMEQNSKGFFENNLLLKINENLLKKMGSSWDDDFYDENKLTAIHEITELEQVLREEFKDSQLFAVKDPRLAYLLPIYIKVLKNLNIDIKVIIPVRNPLEVADSLKTRNHFSQEKGLLLWAYHFLLSEKLSRGFSRVYTSFDELINNPNKVIALIDQALELDLLSKYEQKQDKVRDFLTPGLKHHNIFNDDPSKKAPKIIRDIVRLIPDLNEKDLTEQLDNLRTQLFDYKNLFYNNDISKIIADLEHARQGLQAMDKELEQSKQGLQEKDDELEQARQELQAKDNELEQARQELQAKDNELEQARQELQAKDNELEQARQELQAKDNELKQARQELQAKDNELEQARQGLQEKYKALEQTRQGLHVKDNELNFMKNELVSLYLSKSWKITRPLRKFKKVFKV